MLKPTHLLATTALALLVSACGSGSDPAAAPSAESSISSVKNAGPFAESEMSMRTKMDAAIGSSISDTWLAQMIEHHNGAIAMSKIALAQNPSSEVRQMAEETIAMQGKEIVELKKLRSSGASDPASFDPFRAAGMTMHHSMMAASGADISETYLRKMLEHHRGAVALSDIVIAQGSDPKVRAAAEKTKAVQAKEVTMIEAMLAGKPMAGGSPSKPNDMRAKPADSSGKTALSDQSGMVGPSLVAGAHDPQIPS